MRIVETVAAYGQSLVEPWHLAVWMTLGFLAVGVIKAVLNKSVIQLLPYLAVAFVNGWAFVELTSDSRNTSQASVVASWVVTAGLSIMVLGGFRKGQSFTLLRSLFAWGCSISLVVAVTLAMGRSSEVASGALARIHTFAWALLVVLSIAFACDLIIALVKPRSEPAEPS